MTTQPTALYLADVLANDPCSKAHHDAAAAELRRLHAELAESEKWRDRDEVRAANAEKERDIAEAQRDALLEALRKHVYLHDKDCVCEDCAAIKQAKENT